MNCAEVLKTRVPSNLKIQVKAIADREFLSEAAWLKRLVLREIRSVRGAESGEREICRSIGARSPSQAARPRGASGPPMLVRLKRDDRQLLDARAEARGMRPA